MNWAVRRITSWIFFISLPYHLKQVYSGFLPAQPQTEFRSGFRCVPTWSCVAPRVLQNQNSSDYETTMTITATGH